MGLSFRNAKKWFLMITGKSLLHVNQNLGKCFAPNDLKGYFNNLTEKVLKSDKTILHRGQLPIFKNEKGEKVLFPVAVFQYGLGCYDLFLITNDNIYKDKFLELSDWALEHQEKSGGWNNFGYIYPDKPYGAMCQGEGASLLVRAYNETKNERYLIAAKMALDFMFAPNNKHTLIKSDSEKELIFLEYEDRATVLNGWIFALFGFYDVSIICQTKKYAEIFNRSLLTLKEMIPEFDNGFWSKYDLDNRIASPFYHNLHIAQMEALYYVTNDEVFRTYELKFKRYKKNLINRLKAFLKKVRQKIME